MAWIKLDDQFTTNDKVMAAGKDGRELYISALCHCGKNLTDGFIAESTARQLAAIVEVYDWASAVSRLLEVGLWSTTDGGYLVNDYLEYNPSRDDVESRRAARAERQAKWRDTHRDDNGQFCVDDNGENDDDDDPERRRVSNALQDATVTPASRSRSRSRSPIPHPVPEPVPVVPEDDDGNLLAYFWPKLENAVGLIPTHQIEPYKAMVEDIERDVGPDQQRQFVDSLFHECAMHTRGRASPAWFQKVIDSAIREQRFPGDKRLDTQSTVLSPEQEAEQWAAVAKEYAN